MCESEVRGIWKRGEWRSDGSNGDEITYLDPDGKKRGMARQQQSAKDADVRVVLLGYDLRERRCTSVAGRGVVVRDEGMKGRRELNEEGKEDAQGRDLPKS